MRKFKHFEGRVDALLAAAVDGFELQREGGEAVAEFYALAGVERLVDAAREVKVQQPLLLTAHVVEVALDVLAARPRLLLLMGAGRQERRAEPLLHRFRLLE